jgi:serine/threonine protein kinase
MSHPKVLGDPGVYGFAYWPALFCDNETVAKPEDYISKVFYSHENLYVDGAAIVKKSFEEEVEQLQVVKAIDPEHRFTIKTVSGCYKTFEDFNSDVLKKISRLGEFTHNPVKKIPVINMEYGGTDLDIIAFKKTTFAPLSFEELRTLLTPVLNGLQNLNGFERGERGVVHRDIKPANLLLNDDRTKISVIDWGLACNGSEVFKFTASSHSKLAFKYIIYPPEFNIVATIYNRLSEKAQASNTSDTKTDTDTDTDSYDESREEFCNRMREKSEVSLQDLIDVLTDKPALNRSGTMNLTNATYKGLAFMGQVYNRTVPLPGLNFQDIQEFTNDMRSYFDALSTSGGEPKINAFQLVEKYVMDRRIECKCDIYSLGVVLYILFSKGKISFKGNQRVEFLQVVYSMMALNPLKRISPKDALAKLTAIVIGADADKALEPQKRAFEASSAPVSMPMEGENGKKQRNVGGKKRVNSKPMPKQKPKVTILVSRSHGGANSVGNGGYNVGIAALFKEIVQFGKLLTRTQRKKHGGDNLK